MSEQPYTIGDYAVISEEKDNAPDEVGVVVGHIVMFESGDSYLAFKGDIRKATPVEVAAAKILAMKDELIEEAEGTIRDIVGTAVREELVGIREQINELRAKAISQGLDL